MLINLLRALSYQKRMLAEAALSAAAQDSLQSTVDDLTETLRTVLCLRPSHVGVRPTKGLLQCLNASISEFAPRVRP